MPDLQFGEPLPTHGESTRKPEHNHRGASSPDLSWSSPHLRVQPISAELRVGAVRRNGAWRFEHSPSRYSPDPGSRASPSGLCHHRAVGIVPEPIDKLGGPRVHYLLNSKWSPIQKVHSLPKETNQFLEGERPLRGDTRPQIGIVPLRCGCAQAR